MENVITKQTSKVDALATWDAYEDTIATLRISDMEAEKAFGVNPGRASRFDRFFWNNIYTPDFARALAGETK